MYDGFSQAVVDQFSFTGRVGAAIIPYIPGFHKPGIQTLRGAVWTCIGDLDAGGSCSA
jgi:hypothetical protein